MILFWNVDLAVIVIYAILKILFMTMMMKLNFAFDRECDISE